MKSLILLLSLTPSILGAIVVPVKQPELSLDSDSFGPYVVGKSNVTHEVNITNVSPNKATSLELRAYISSTSEKNFCFYGSTVQTLYANQVKKCTIPDFSPYIGTGIFYLTFKCFVSSKEFCSTTLILHVFDEPTVSMNDKNVYNAPHYSGYIYDSYPYYENEKFDFTGMKNSITTDNQGALNLSSLSFTYTQTLKVAFTYESIYLKLPSCYSNNNVPNGLLKLSTNSDLTFRIADILYVQPQTLAMSLFPLEGYSLTSYFYLPRDNPHIFEGCTFLITLNKCGYSKTSFSINIPFEEGIQLFGKCNEAQYCIRGGIVS